MTRDVHKTPESINMEIAEIDAKIQTYQDKVVALKAREKKLLASKDKSEMESLYELIKAFGKKPSELIEQLTS